MLKQNPMLRRTPVVWLVSLFLLASLILAACGGATESVSEAPTTSVEVEEPTASAETEEPATPTETAKAVDPTATKEEAEEAPTATATEADASAEESDAAQQENLLASPSAAISCQTVEIPDNDLVAAVSDKDWAKGPADAPVTLIEYADFQ